MGGLSAAGNTVGGHLDPEATFWRVTVNIIRSFLEFERNERRSSLR